MRGPTSFGSGDWHAPRRSQAGLCFGGGIFACAGRVTGSLSLGDEFDELVKLYGQDDREADFEDYLFHLALSLS